MKRTRWMVLLLLLLLNPAALVAADVELQAKLNDEIERADALWVKGVLGDNVLMNAIVVARKAYDDGSATELTLSTLQDAVQAYLEKNCLNSLLVNCNMDDGTGGWTTNFATIATGDSYPGFGGVFQEKWTPHGGTLGDFYSYQEITGLPDGNYTFAAYCIATQQVYTGEECRSTVQGVYLFANNTTVPVATLNEQPARFTVTTTVTNGTLRVGFMSENCTANWIAFDNVMLYALDANVIWSLKRDEASTINPLDITRMIVNPSFEEDATAMTKAMPKGWTAEGYTTQCGWYGVNMANGWDDLPTDGSYLFGVWDGSVQSAGISQRVGELPMGFYRLGADMLASDRLEGTPRIGKQCLYCDDDTAFFSDLCETLAGDGVPLQPLSLTFYVEDGSEIKIGVNTADAPNETWFKVDNFTLAYLGRSALAGYDQQYADLVVRADKMIAAYPYVFGPLRGELDSLCSVNVSLIASPEEYQLLIDALEAVLQQGYSQEMIETYGLLYEMIENYYLVNDLAEAVSEATDVLVSPTAGIDEVTAAIDKLYECVAQYEAGTLHLQDYLNVLRELVVWGDSVKEMKMRLLVASNLKSMIAKSGIVLENESVKRDEVIAQTELLSDAIEQAGRSISAYEVLLAAIDEALDVYRAYGSKESVLSAAIEAAQKLYNGAIVFDERALETAAELDDVRKAYVKEQLVLHDDLTADGLRVSGGNVLVITSEVSCRVTVYSLNGRVRRTVDVPAGITTVDGMGRGVYIVEGKKITIK